MKILFIITGLGMGGAEQVVTNLADALSDRNHEVQIVFLTGEILVRPTNPNIKIISLNFNRPKHIIKSYLKLRYIIKNMKPDVIHSHMFHANLLSRLIRLTTKVPKLISSSHNTNEGGQLRMMAYRFTDKLVDISTNVSNEAVNALIKTGATKHGRMVCVVNGINTDKFKFNKKVRYETRNNLRLSEDIAMILAVGSLSPQKDYPNLLKAVAKLKNIRSDFKLFIVGDGKLRDELLNLIIDLELTEFVELLGIRNDVPNLMSACDIFTLSSAWEGFGLVVAEAMACERIVVATDCGGVKEVMGNNGILIKPNNSTILSDALNEALNYDEKQRACIGANARQHIVDNFSLEANVDSYLSLYLS